MTFEWSTVFDASLGLAAELRDRYPAAGLLEEARYLPVPRGGIFVLGHLLYALNINPALQSSSSALTIIVDDCACSGARLARTLREIESRDAGTGEIAVALLAAPIGFAGALRARSPRVSSVHVAAELEPVAAGDLAAEHPFHQDVLAGRRFAFGVREPLVFPWGEVERPVWNAATRQLEDGYTTSLPHELPAAWASLDLPPAAVGSRRIRAAPGVRYRLGLEDRAVSPASGEVIGLKDSARATWRALLAYGSEPLAVEYLASLYDAPRELLAEDVARVAAELISRGILTAD